MSFEEDFLKELNSRQDGINAFRSYLQRLELSGFAPEEFVAPLRNAQRRRILCNYCEPLLVMIADPAYYAAHREELAERNGQFKESPVAFGHGLGIRPGEIRRMRFVGVRGMKFSISYPGNHIDCVEMDEGALRYFDGLGESGKEDFLHYYLKHVDSWWRLHVNRFRELYAAFVSRRPPEYHFAVDKAVRLR